MKSLAIGAAALLLLTSALACQPPGSGVSQGDIDEIKAQQQEILKKLAAIETAQKAAAPAARPGPPPEDFDKVYEISTEGSPVLGNPDAPVAVVEYSDFQCPFCVRVQPILKELLEKHPDDVKLVFKHFPLSFHRAARPTAIASMAAMEQGKFWEMHDVLFANQRTLDPAKIDEYAKEAGLDLERFKKDMETKAQEYAKKVDADFREGQSVDVRGTPSLYIGGKKVRARSIEAMSQMVKEALERKG